MCDEFGRTKITNFNKREKVSLETTGMFGLALLGLGLSGSPGPLPESYRVAFPLVSLRVFFFFFPVCVCTTLFYSPHCFYFGQRLILRVLVIWFQKLLRTCNFTPSATL